MPQSLNAVIVIIVFIIPGFITDRIISLTIPRAKREATEIILTAITFSCINYAIFFWLILLMIFKGFPSQYKTWFIWVYIEELWVIDEEGKFKKPVPASGGCLIQRNEINFIEFFKPEKEVKTQNG